MPAIKCLLAAQFLGAILFFFRASSASAASADLVGTWVTQCVPRSSATRNRITLRADGTFSLALERGLDETCSDAIGHVTGTYAVGEEWPTGSGQYKITYRFVQADITALTVRGAWGASFFNLCGISSWSRNVPQSVLGRDCGDDGMIPAQNGLVYDIVRLRDGKVVFGLPTSTQNRMTPEATPTAYDEELPYTQQPAAPQG